MSKFLLIFLFIIILHVAVAVVQSLFAIEPESAFRIVIIGCLAVCLTDIMNLE